MPRCNAHSECESGLCDLTSGACVRAGNILYVAADGTGADCTEATPCGSIQQAVDQTGGQHTWIQVGAGSYTETVTITGKSVHIVGAGAELSPAALQQPCVHVSGDADVLIEGLRLHDAGGTGDADDGIACDTSGGVPALRIARALIDGNGDKGVDAAGCTVAIVQSVVRGNGRGGLLLDGADLLVINDVIVQNGSPVSAIGGASVSGLAGSRVEHVTIADNVVQDGIAGGLICTGGLALRNNIVFGNDEVGTGQVSGNCPHRFSLIGPTGEDGQGNLTDPPTFTGDYHLADGSSGIDAAEASDVEVDIDGDARPSGDGPDMGADELVR